MSFRIFQSQEIDALIDESGFEKLSYDSQFKQYRIRVESSNDEKQKESLLSLVRVAYDAYRK